MDGYGYGSGHGSNTCNRRVEIVSGRSSFNTTNQIYSTRPHSPDFRPGPSRVTRLGETTTKPWGFGDPEMKRRRRIAKYKVYTVEGKVKGSIRRGINWIKNKCSQIIHGY